MLREVLRAEALSCVPRRRIGADKTGNQENTKRHENPTKGTREVQVRHYWKGNVKFSSNLRAA